MVSGRDSCIGADCHSCNRIRAAHREQSVLIWLAMTLRSGVYIVPTNRWDIERTVWLIAGVVLLASTGMALLLNPLWIFGVIATGVVYINVAFTGYCPVGSVLRLLGFTPMLGSETSGRWNLYRMQTDK